MSDKPVAFLVTAAIVAPICALCLFGPALFALGFGWVSGWLGGIDPLLAGGLAVLVGILVFALTRRRMAKKPRQDRSAAGPPGPIS